MPGCEKCWHDAGMRSFLEGRQKIEVYYELLDERADHPCTPEEQCGDLHVVFDWNDGTSHCMCGKVVKHIEEAK